MVYDTGANVRIRASALSVAGVCASLAGSLSSGGSYWTVRAQSLDATAGNGQVTLLCRVVDPKGTLELEVMDTGGMFNGKSICANLVAKGWFDVG